jgi:hypothetical protein
VHESITILTRANGEELDNARLQYYTRHLCNAAIDYGSLHRLQILTKEISIDDENRPHNPIDNALAVSSYYGKHSALQRLIADGAKDIEDHHWRFFGSPIVCTTVNGSLEIVRTLLATETFHQSSLSTAMRKSARHGQFDILYLFLDHKGAKFDRHDYVKIIHDAAAGGQIEILQFMLSVSHIFGLNPSDHDSSSCWAHILRSACKKGTESVVRMALERGVELFAPATFLEKGEILALASLHGHENLVRLLLSQLKFGKGTSSLYDALCSAADYGCLSICKLIVQH